MTAQEIKKSEKSPETGAKRLKKSAKGRELHQEKSGRMRAARKDLRACGGEENASVRQIPLDLSRRGLGADEVARSRAQYGSNLFTQKRGKGFWRTFFSNLGDPVIRVLLLALLVHLVLLFRDGDLIETVGIAVSVLIATLISTASEYGSETAFSRLCESCGVENCRVLRDGCVCEIPSVELVVGDLVLLGAGERIPCDGVLLSGKMNVDQSPLTGESRELEKRPFIKGEPVEPGSAGALFSGCTVISGQGEMRVTAVGDHTFLGGISGELQDGVRESPLKERLSRLARQISRVGYAAAVLCALAFLFHHLVLDARFEWSAILARLCDLRSLSALLLRALTLALTVVVVAVPEGLPMMIAVVLSSNIRRMMHDMVLVRRPAGLEAAGSMNILFTDKTGTLTQGKPALCAILTQNGEYKSARALEKADVALFSALLCAVHANNGAVRGQKDGIECALGGNATDRAVLTAFLHRPAPDFTVTARLPFDSDRKYSAVELADGRVFVAGAPERLIPRLSGGYGGAPVQKAALLSAISSHTGRGERVLLCCMAQGLPDPEIRGTLTLLGALCFSDPLRPEASEAVRTLQGAGVQVVMITGDSRETAARIAADCGILRRGGAVVQGNELAEMSDDELRELLPRLAVVARALPRDKSRLVDLCASSGLVVGMTGDGINDAPALKKADVGFSMGSGTQVAKEASDVVILDDNLGSIVRAVLFGRTVFMSIRKFITLQMVMNFCAVGISIIGPFIGFDTPVTVVQMLWINLIMDTLGGLAFAGEAPMPFYMKQPPKRRDEPILTRGIAARIAYLSTFTVALSVFFLKSPTVRGLFREGRGDQARLLTAFFALFIFAGVFNCFNARTDRLSLFVGISRNRAFLLIMPAVALVQIAFVYLGGSLLRTVPLTPRELAITLLLAATVIPAGFLHTLFRRLSGKGGIY